MVTIDGHYEFIQWAQMKYAYAVFLTFRIHGFPETHALQGYRISTDLNEIDVPFVHAFIGDSYWAKGIPLATLRTALEQSLCFGVFEESGAQVGFARVITDSATFAYLSDVFIGEAFRGQGLSKWLMETILAHADLQGLRRFVLATQDAHELYEQFGFRPLANPQMFMEIWTPDIYTRPG